MHYQRQRVSTPSVYSILNDSNTFPPLVFPSLKPSGTGSSSPTSTVSGRPAIISLPPSPTSGFRTLCAPSPTTAPSAPVLPRNIPRFRFHRGGEHFPQIHSRDPQNDAPKEGEQELVKRETDSPDHEVGPPTYRSPRIPIWRRL